MNSHDEIRGLLPLSAAGLLNPPDERKVREHIQGCGECAACLDEFALLAGEFTRLPAPPVPLDLAARTQMLIAAELAAQADRRLGAVLAGAAGLLGWALALLMGLFCKIVLGWNVWIWLALFTAAGLLAAPVAIALPRLRAATERSAS